MWVGGGGTLPCLPLCCSLRHIKSFPPSVRLRRMLGMSTPLLFPKPSGSDGVLVQRPGTDAQAGSGGASSSSAAAGERWGAYGRSTLPALAASLEQRGRREGPLRCGAPPRVVDHRNMVLLLAFFASGCCWQLAHSRRLSALACPAFPCRRCLQMA